jgi:YD repeat-containing protein
MHMDLRCTLVRECRKWTRIGGRLKDTFAVTDVVEVYVPAEGRWYCSIGDGAAGCTPRTVADPIIPAMRPIPTPRTNMAVAAVWSDSYIFLMGGQDSSNRYVTTVEVYSVRDGKWYCSVVDSACDGSRPDVIPNAIRSLPTARAFAAGATGPDGRIYVFGGFDGTSITGRVEAWDPETQSWYCSRGDDACAESRRILAPLPTARAALGGLRGSTGLLYLIGGTDDSVDFTPLPTVEAYDVYTNRWYCSAAVTGCTSGFRPSPLPTARLNLAVAAGPDGRIYAVGGDQAGLSVGSVESYDPKGNAWRVAPALPSPRAATAAIASADALYAIGGQGTLAPSTVTGRVEAHTPPPPVPAEAGIARERSYPSTHLPPSQALLTRGARYRGLPINTVFGNYTYQHTDQSLPGFGPEVAIARTYSSAYPRRGLFGWGWSSTFEMRLAVGAATVQVTHGDGRVDTHTWQGPALAPPAGSVDQLVRHPDGTYTLTTRQHLVYRFNGQGRLLSLQDSDGNATSLQYDPGGRWTGVQDAGGRL